LTDSDSKLLSSFFEDITADQYNMPSFGEGLNFSEAWFDLPPQFMGTATSFGQQHTPLASPGMLSMSNMSSMSTGYPRATNQSQMMPPPPPPSQPSVQPAHSPHQQQQLHHSHQLQHLHAQHQQPHSDEVLSAAATLLQNGSASRNNHNSSEHVMSQQASIPTAGHPRHQGMDEFREEGRRTAAQDTQQDPSFPGWLYSGQATAQDRPVPRSSLPTDFQWGSDANFSSVQGYTPDTNKETVESMHQEQLEWMKCLSVSKSAASTRPSSPTPIQRNPPPLRTEPPQLRLSDPPKPREDPQAPPRKRRKSKSNREAADNDEEDATEETTTVTTSKAPRRRKSKVEQPAVESAPVTEPGPPSGGKRRKSAANGAKPPRENLTEEQKRENHIRSEQKRRTLIKEGFDDLCELVPGLRGGGFSKSTMLTMAADWLEELIKGNEVLSGQLAAQGK
jgi:hypothetical protein